MGATIQEIGYAFLQTYYHRMSKDPSKVSCLYSATAELTHTNYQVDITSNSDTLPTVKLTGKENISKFFTRNNKKVSDLKVKVETCDFQTTGPSHSGILVLITGEMFWTGTPTYKFVQTVILAPSGYKDTFDVTNDVIRFLGDNLTMEVEGKQHDKRHDEEPIREPVKEPVKESTNESSNELPNQTDKKQPLIREQDVSNSEARIGKDQEPKEETKEEAKEENMASGIMEGKKDSQKPQESNSENRELAKGSSQDNVSQSSQSQQQQPVRISWASKLASNGDSSKMNNSELQYSGTTSKKTVDSKSDLSGRKDISKVEKTEKTDRADRADKVDRATNKKKPVFSTVNKDGYYPIYIKGTAGIREDKLKNALETEFGTVMKITNADNFAVADFEIQKSQIDALDKRQLTVDDTEIVMGRKTVKKSPSPPVTNTQTTLRPHKKYPGKKRE